jgi:histidinol-phosphate aminotransferase
MGSSEFKFDLSKCARPNILKLQPYRCARDDYKDDGTNILLDANENAYGPGLDMVAAEKAIGGLRLGELKLNRYPDP